VTAITLVDIGALDAAAGEPLGIFDGVFEGVAVIRITWQRPGMGARTGRRERGQVATGRWPRGQYDRQSCGRCRG